MGAYPTRRPGPGPTRRTTPYQYPVRGCRRAARPTMNEVPVRVTVVALGKIGLPLAAQFAGKGHEVVGVDVNAETVDLVNAGKAPFPGEAGLAEALAEIV